MQPEPPRLCVIFAVLSLLLCLLVACGETAATPNPDAASLPSFNSTEADMLLNTVTPTLAEPTATSTPLPPAHVVIIDPGHGADDWGTFHTDSNDQPDILEKDIVLKIGQKIAAQMDPATYKVVLTRTTDSSPNNPPQDFNGDGKIDQIDDLQARINIANENKGEIFLSLHINSSELGNEVSGLETWYTADRPFGAQSR